MNELAGLTLLIHGFVYEYLAAQAPARAESLAAYLHRERQCQARWRDALEQFQDHAALLVVPIGGAQPPAATSFYEEAARRLGTRFFLLDAGDARQAEFWREDSAFLAADLAALCQGQGWAWNKEELDTWLHCRACWRQFRKLLAARGLRVAPSVETAAWGASFDGCVTKYSLYLANMLGLEEPVRILAEDCVPDYAPLLGATTSETLNVAGQRIFTFVKEGRCLALPVFARHRLGDPPAALELALPPGSELRNKQGRRLWPDPEPNDLPTAPPGFYEPAQPLVQATAAGIRIPLAAGLVYRLAKAPAYLHAPPDLAPPAWHKLLLSASLA